MNCNKRKNGQLIAELLAKKVLIKPMKQHNIIHIVTENNVTFQQWS